MVALGLGIGLGLATKKAWWGWLRAALVAEGLGVSDGVGWKLEWWRWGAQGRGTQQALPRAAPCPAPT